MSDTQSETNRNFEGLPILNKVRAKVGIKRLRAGRLGCTHHLSHSALVADVNEEHRQ